MITTQDQVPFCDISALKGFMTERIVKDQKLKEVTYQLILSLMCNPNLQTLKKTLKEVILNINIFFYSIFFFLVRFADCMRYKLKKSI